MVRVAGQTIQHVSLLISAIKSGALEVVRDAAHLSRRTVK